MLKSLYMKLVLILILLILSLMAVVGVFLTGSVARFFMDDFSAQMSSGFSENLEFIRSLQSSASAADMADRVAAYGGTLGINNGSRCYYVLDGATGAALVSGPGGEERVDLTPNIRAAISGSPGNSQSLAGEYFDCAVPVSAAGSAYIVYIRDSKEALTTLNRDLFMIIIEAVLLGLIISVLLSLLLSKTMTTPIENLTRGASNMAAGDFSHKLEVRSSDEIGVLTETFNNMAGVLHDTLGAVEGERDKLGTLFLHMTDGVVAFTRDGSPLHINLAAQRLLGIRDIDDFGYDRLAGAASLDEVAGLRPPEYLERSMESGGRSLRLFFAPFGTDETESGVMAVIHDNTEQARLEALRREFVSNVSHELRTPLTGIKSYAETLLEPEELSMDTIRQFSAVIVSETDRMTRLVRDLLTLSKFDHGKMDFAFAFFDMEGMLRHVYDLMRLEAQKREHRLTLDISGEIPEIWGDRDRLEQVMINIVANAISYTPDGGLIGIKACVSGAFFTVEVRDSGIGIPEEDLPYIFERFYRVDKARSRSMGGTGLGLAIAREIVERNGGTIEITSVSGKGTAVFVALPLGRPDAEDGK